MCVGGINNYAPSCIKKGGQGNCPGAERHLLAQEVVWEQNLPLKLLLYVLRKKIVGIIRRIQSGLKIV